MLWSDAGDGGGEWLFALMFASYSLGAHGRGRAVVLGGLQQLGISVSPACGRAAASHRHPLELPARDRVNHMYFTALVDGAEW